MSRMPPIPAANQSPYGPGAVARDAVTDLSHHTDLPSAVHRQDAQEQQRAGGGRPQRHGGAAQVAVDDLGGSVSAGGRGSDALMLVVFGALVAAIVWVAGQQRRHANEARAPRSNSSF